MCMTYLSLFTFVALKADIAWQTKNAVGVGWMARELVEWLFNWLGKGLTESWNLLSHKKASFSSHLPINYHIAVGHQGPKEGGHESPYYQRNEVGQKHLSLCKGQSHEPEA